MTSKSTVSRHLSRLGGAALAFTLASCTITSDYLPSGYSPDTAPFLGRWIGADLLGLYDDLTVTANGDGTVQIDRRDLTPLRGRLTQVGNATVLAIRKQGESFEYYELYRVQLDDDSLKVAPLDRPAVAKDVKAGLLSGVYLAPDDLDQSERALVKASSDELASYLASHPDRFSKQPSEYLRPTAWNRIRIVLRKVKLLAEAAPTILTAFFWSSPITFTGLLLVVVAIVCIVMSRVFKSVRKRLALTGQIKHDL